MSYTELGIVVGIIWLAVGLILSLVMGRRGHDAFGWLILGALFGPLTAVLALYARRTERPGHPFRSEKAWRHIVWRQTNQVTKNSQLGEGMADLPENPHQFLPLPRGEAGGEIVAMGRPEDVASVEQSHTGAWLRTVLPAPVGRGRATGSRVAVSRDS